MMPFVSYWPVLSPSLVYPPSLLLPKGCDLGHSPWLSLVILSAERESVVRRSVRGSSGIAGQGGSPPNRPFKIAKRGRDERRVCVVPPQDFLRAQTYVRGKAGLMGYPAVIHRTALGAGHGAGLT